MSRIMKNDWIECELGEICFTTSGGTPSRTNKEFYEGSIPWVKSGELDKGIIYDTEEHISENAVKNSSAKIFPKGTLLIALYGATIGKLAFLGVDATTNQAICGIFESNAIEPKYLFNYLLNNRQKLISQGTGGAQPNISQTILKKLPIPLSPLPIQRAIVRKIEMLFSDLDNGIANFKKAQAQLKVYRQAVLKKAFEGKLSELGKGGLKDDRIIDKDNKHKEILQSSNPKNPNSDEKGDNLPTGWKWVKICEIGKIETGTTPSKNNPEFYSNDFPFYKPTDLIAGENVVSSTDGLSKKGIEKARYVPEFSILVTCIGATIGKTGFIKRGGGFNQQINAIVTNSLVVPKFVYYQAISLNFQKQIKDNASATTLPILNKGKFEKLKMLIPPTLNEQAQIVSEIERRLSVCDQMEQSITESLQKAEALRQSILKKAFEGRLLSEAEIKQCQQEPDYEPASELLKKIKLEKMEKEEQTKKKIKVEKTKIKNKK